MQRIPAVRNYQVNVVLARLEFELDTNRLSVADVMNKLVAKTGYTFEEHIIPKGQVLELLVNDPTLLHLAGIPFGVTQIDTIETQDKHRNRLGRHFSMLTHRHAICAIGSSNASQVLWNHASICWMPT